MINLTDATFDSEVGSNDLILVDFWADWCGPCKKMLPILEEIDSEGVLLVGKLNVDENTKKTQEFSVTSIPSMVLFKSGQPVKTIVGAKPKHLLLEELKEWI
jgi:thioredoxin 1